jgi:amino acid transporter
MRDAHSPESLAPALSPGRAVVLIVGIIIGSGIFALPAQVALFSGGLWAFVGLWVAAGLLSVLAALCYAELAAAYPDRGGEYSVLVRVYGRTLGFLFVWCRSTIMQTGAIAALAFIFGEYAVRLMGWPEGWAPWLGAAAVLVFTLTNLVGLLAGVRAQTVLTVAEVVGLALVIVAGLLFAEPSRFMDPTPVAGPPADWALALMFALFAFGGWSEASYLSADMADRRRGIVKAIAISMALITLLYLAISVAFVNALGLAGVAASKTVATDAITATLGPGWAGVVALIVMVAALSSINTSIITGGRAMYALGRDWPLFGWLGAWRERTAVPAAAMVAQALIIFALIGFGAQLPDGFGAMVAYTAPAFWLFISLVVLGLMVLRRREPDHPRPFKVPLYPLVPLVVIATTGYVAYATAAYAFTQPGVGALVGLIVLASGAVILLACRVLGIGAPTPLSTTQGVSR